MTNELEKHDFVKDSTIWLYYEDGENDLDLLEAYIEELNLVEYRVEVGSESTTHSK